MTSLPPLPIDECLPELIDALKTHRRVVLQAPPGAGKSSRVPLALRSLQEQGRIRGRILMLEPRRLAARATAARLAEQIGEPLGQSVGYRVRGDSKSGRDIEVVTEGILTRMIQSDNELAGIGAIIFDEFHERSLHADLGLALSWDIAQILRTDLHLIVMSATLDAAPVAQLLDNAPIITSQGRSFAVTQHYLERPLRKEARLPLEMARLIEQAAQENSGGILAFLPGEYEIRRTQDALNLPDDCHIMPLYASMPFAQQRAALTPIPSGRKVVLSTAIAQTSLTIEDIHIVVDSGLARRARFDMQSGMSRLVTERASKAELTQRAGRAGRVATGHAYGLWSKAETGQFPAFSPAGIEVEDLSALALELAIWGSDDLSFLTQPPNGSLEQARDLLARLGALDVMGRLTEHGRKIAKHPLHPRLAHMVHIAGRSSANLAALLSARDPLYKHTVDLLEGVKILRQETSPPPKTHGAFKAIKADADRLKSGLKGGADLSDGQQAALAYPDRIGLRRNGVQARYILSGGRGAEMEASASLANARLIVATDLEGGGRNANIRRAIQITERELRELFDEKIHWEHVCVWSSRDQMVRTRYQERFGALVLADQNWSEASRDEVARAMCEGIRELGFRFSKASLRFLARVQLYKGMNETFPDLSNDVLMQSLEQWLLPFLQGVRTAQHWKDFDVLPALKTLLSWQDTQDLDACVPGHYLTPLGRKTPITYDEGGVPQIHVRLQEMFGQTTHPHIMGKPLKIYLLSPAHKPVQVTQDLPGFWQSSYHDVCKDMRGTYPRHPWPEDPRQALPTVKTTKAQNRSG